MELDEARGESVWSGKIKFYYAVASYRIDGRYLLTLHFIDGELQFYDLHEIEAKGG